ncbi:MAG: hypothetical protein ACR2PW_07930 [Gammaproteobacteria bacterium]
MKRYLVGGYVRDTLLGRPAGDRDWVVIGSTPEQMIQMGFKAIGEHIPVFIDRETREEHALARLEYKSGTGHKGFLFQAAPTVTLEEDLTRRDLRINAMAMNEQGQLIDPLGGKKDLDKRILRHISPAFAEDPLRLLRVARFLAQLAPYGFTLAPETQELMCNLAASGELATLPAERVWRETQLALAAPCPERFFTTLQECQALEPFFSELSPDLSLLLPPLEQALGLDAEWRWAALLHLLPRTQIAALTKRLKCPRLGTQAALAACDSIALMRSSHQTGEQIFQILKQNNAWRNPERFYQLTQLQQCLSPTPTEQWWKKALALTQSVPSELTPPAKGEEQRYALTLKQRRIEILQHWISSSIQLP